MSTLIVDELYPGVVFSQPFRIKRGINIACVRPWIYRNNDLLDGSLRLTVKQGSETLVVKELTFTEINAGFTENYAHGFLRFDFDALALNVSEGNTEEEYILEYEMVNHNFAADNYIGIVRRWEAKTYPTYGDGVIDNEAPNDMVEPSGLELFEYKEI